MGTNLQWAQNYSTRLCNTAVFGRKLSGTLSTERIFWPSGGPYCCAEIYHGSLDLSGFSLCFHSRHRLTSRDIRIILMKTVVQGKIVGIAVHRFRTAYRIWVNMLARDHHYFTIHPPRCNELHMYDADVDIFRHCKYMQRCGNC